MRFEDKHTLVSDMKDALATEGPVLVDVRVTREENTFPMIPAGQPARTWSAEPWVNQQPRKSSHSMSWRPSRGSAAAGSTSSRSSSRTNRASSARISGLFARRAFDLDTLAVGPTDDESVSRMTLTLDGAVHPIDQVTKQLHKLVNVLKIRDLEPGETLSRELALFKISADGVSRAEVMQICEIFRAKIVDVTKRSVVIEVTGTYDKVEAFERLVRPFGLIEMARTGEIAISRGRGET